MLFSVENMLLIGSVLLIISIVVGKTGYRFGVPALLLFLLVGMFFGSDGLGLQFNNTHQAQAIGMVALSVILFSGGMDTKVADIKPIMSAGVVLSTAGVLLTALFTGLFIWIISGMSFTNISFPLTTSLLLAATMSSTDSASVFAILRSQKMNLKHNLRPMLELESGSNDPMAYMLTIVLIQIILSGSMNAGEIAGNLAVQFLVGGAGGYILGKLTVLFLNKINIDNQSLYAILLLGCVFFTFTITDRLHGNGYLAVYIAGMVVGNKKIVFRKEIATFMDGMSWLFQIIMFLTLGLLVNPHEMLNVALVAILVGVFLILIGRPLSVFLCLLPFRKINFKSKLFVSWVGLRGAVPIIFATYPVVAGVEGSNSIFNIVFFITIVSLVVQGTSISFFARLLHLSAPLPQTGNEFGVELPEEIDSSLSDMTVTPEMIEQADTLKEMNLPQGTLVMIVKRGNEFLIPNGSLKLHVGDKLLLISEKEKS
ncbi:potassium/proton antiporter [Bacteroides graminisolvens]|uniref:Na(+)/H(+) antiporter n=1 Tax=Bacteroides graminisolvens DSM 19988 = JCM 15093 TaxID=1121097 RepID=A0A069D4L7_9BACE|nr:potassium/proton antiporter [Bacteroides graminisolvens]GAK37285.1 Na(+)/H(+) antiporter [Bacteroides graminisolvens DSM 19988 = JCM 15093]